MSNEKNSSDKLIEAYDSMMLHVSESLSKATTAVGPKVREALESAEAKLEDIGELTREEIDKVSEYLRRDIHDAATYIAGPEGQELKDWLRFDIELIEARLMEMFLSAADQAKLDMQSFESELRAASEYSTGEITGPGTLLCNQCGEVLHFHNTGHIPPCPQCRSTDFVRQEAYD